MGTPFPVGRRLLVERPRAESTIKPTRDSASSRKHVSAGSRHDEERRRRLCYLTPELRVLRAKQFERMEQLAERTGKIIPYGVPRFRACALRKLLLFA